MTVTPEDVRNVLFDKPPLGRRGYSADDVDVLLDRIELALAGTVPMTAEEVRTVVFTKGTLTRRGYDEIQVDAFLDLVAAELADATGRHESPP